MSTTWASSPADFAVARDLDGEWFWVLRHGEDEASPRVPVARPPLTLHATGEFDHCACLSGDGVVLLNIPCRGYADDSVELI